MTPCAKGNEILLGIIATLAPELTVVNMELLTSTAVPTSPIVTLQYLPTAGSLGRVALAELDPRHEPMTAPNHLTVIKRGVSPPALKQVSFGDANPAQLQPL